MSCDINITYEVRKNGVWTFHDWKSQFNVGPPDEKTGEQDHDCDKMWKHPLHVRQNYALFSILANVRNDGDVFTPIDNPRGMPFDASPEARETSNRMGEDGHSHSWVTLKELLVYNWHKTIFRTGFVTAEDYWRYIENGKPDNWCTFVGGDHTRIVSGPEMLAAIQRDKTTGLYTEICWGEQTISLVVNFVRKTIPELQKLGKPEDVRLVFFFDC